MAEGEGSGKNWKALSARSPSPAHAKVQNIPYLGLRTTGVIDVPTYKTNLFAGALEA